MTDLTNVRQAFQSVAGKGQTVLSLDDVDAYSAALIENEALTASYGSAITDPAVNRELRRAVLMSGGLGLNEAGQFEVLRDFSRNAMWYGEDAVRQSFLAQNVARVQSVFDNTPFRQNSNISRGSVLESYLDNFFTPEVTEALSVEYTEDGIPTGSPQAAISAVAQLSSAIAQSGFIPHDPAQVEEALNYILNFDASFYERNEAFLNQSYLLTPEGVEQTVFTLASMSSAEFTDYMNTERMKRQLSENGNSARTYAENLKAQGLNTLTLDQAINGAFEQFGNGVIDSVDDVNILIANMAALRDEDAGLMTSYSVFEHNNNIDTLGAYLLQRVMSQRPVSREEAASMIDDARRGRGSQTVASRLNSLRAGDRQRSDPERFNYLSNVLRQYADADGVISQEVFAQILNLPPGESSDNLLRYLYDLPEGDRTEVIGMTADTLAVNLSAYIDLNPATREAILNA